MPVVFLTFDAAQWVSAPSGFGYGDTADNYGSGMSPQMRAEFWWKTATTSDVSASGWTFTVSGPPASTSTAVGAAFRGVDTATGADLGFADGNFSNSGTGGWSDNWSANSTATSLTVPGVTTVGANRLAVTFTVSAANGVTFTPPSGYNEQIDTTYTTGRNIEVATKALPTAGATGSVQTTTNTGSGLVGYHLTLRPVTTSGTTTTVTYIRDAADRVIERKVNGTTVARYAHTAAGDSPQLVLNATNTVVERNVALPAGVLLTTRGSTAADVWSYPNTHGDITAVTNGSGVKQGATRGYDPWGNPLGTTTLPDNNAGNWDYTWHGAQQRPLEHEAGLTPTIEMGARQYAPQLGRFLETDPIEGGCANDYIYVKGDPIGSEDLSGEKSCSFKRSVPFIRYRSDRVRPRKPSQVSFTVRAVAEDIDGVSGPAYSTEIRVTSAGRQVAYKNSRDRANRSRPRFDTADTTFTVRPGATVRIEVTVKFESNEVWYKPWTWWGGVDQAGATTTCVAT